MNLINLLKDRAQQMAIFFRASFWAIPSLLLLLAVALSLLSLWLDLTFPQQLDLRLFGRLDASPANGMSSILSTTAAAILGVAGVSFSITIASLTLASQQFGPRLIRNFIQDRFIQVVLGFFVATFLFCMLSIQLSSVITEASSYTPVFTLAITLVLTITDLLLLVLFIHHICISIQADSVISEVSDALQKRIALLYPESTVSPTPAEEQHIVTLDRHLRKQGIAVRAKKDGYIQRIDIDGLVDYACAHDRQIRFSCRAGDYIMTRSNLAQISGSNLPDGAENAVNGFVLTGFTRDPQQDMEYSIRQLVEIALRALSPGINDPFTAMTCIDRLGSGLSEIATRPSLSPAYYDADNSLRLVMPVSDYQGLVEASFNQIRQNARGQVDVTIRLLEVVKAVICLTKDEHQAAALLTQAKLIYDTCDSPDTQQHDRDDIEERYQNITKTIAQLYQH